MPRGEGNPVINYCSVHNSYEWTAGSSYCLYFVQHEEEMQPCQWTRDPEWVEDEDKDEDEDE